MPPRRKSQEYTEEELKITDEIINKISGAVGLKRAVNGKNYKSKQLKVFLNDNRSGIRTILNEANVDPSSVERLVLQSPNLWASLEIIARETPGPITAGMVENSRMLNNLERVVAVSTPLNSQRMLTSMLQASGDEASEEADDDSDYINALAVEALAPAPAPVAIGLDVETPTPTDPSAILFQQLVRDAPAELYNLIMSNIPAQYRDPVFMDTIRDTSQLISEAKSTISPSALVSGVITALTGEIANRYFPTLSPLLSAVAGDVSGRLLGIDKKQQNKAKQFLDSGKKIFKQKTPSLGGVTVEELKAEPEPMRQSDKKESPPSSSSLRLLPPTSPPLKLQPQASAPLKLQPQASAPLKLQPPASAPATPQIMFTEERRKEKIAPFPRPSLRTVTAGEFDPLLGRYVERPVRVDMSRESKRVGSREQEAEMSLKNDLRVANAPGGLSAISSAVSGAPANMGMSAPIQPEPKKLEPKKPEPKKPEPKKPEPKKPEQKRPEQKKPEAKQPEVKQTEPDEEILRAGEEIKRAKASGNMEAVKEIYNAMKLARKPIGALASLLTGAGLSLADLGILDDDDEEVEYDPEVLKNITSLQNGISRQKINYDATLFMKDINPPKDLLKPTQTDAQNDLFTMFNYRQDPLKDSVLLQADRGVQLLNATIYIDIDTRTTLRPTGSGTYRTNFSLPEKPINMDYFSRFENNKGYDDFSAGPMKFLYAQ